MLVGGTVGLRVLSHPALDHPRPRLPLRPALPLGRGRASRLVMFGAVVALNPEWRAIPVLAGRSGGLADHPAGLLRRPAAQADQRHRARRGGQPRQEPLPGRDEPRAAHAAQRDHRHERASGHDAARYRAARHDRHGPHGCDQPAGAGRPGAGSRQDRGAPLRDRGRAVRSARQPGRGCGCCWAISPPPRAWRCACGSHPTRPTACAAARASCTRCWSTWSATPSSSPSAAGSSSEVEPMAAATAETSGCASRSRTPASACPPEAQAHLFERFARSDDSVRRGISGSGLGLNITRELVQLMGGTVGMSSVLGQGSTFWIELPFELRAERPARRRERLAGRVVVVGGRDSGAWRSPSGCSASAARRGASRPPSPRRSCCAMASSRQAVLVTGRDAAGRSRGPGRLVLRRPGRSSRST